MSYYFAGFQTGSGQALFYFTKAPQIPYMLPCVLKMHTFCHAYHTCVPQEPCILPQMPYILP